MFFEESDPLDLWPIAAPPLISSWVNLAEKQQHLLEIMSTSFIKIYQAVLVKKLTMCSHTYTCIRAFPFLHLNKYIKIHLTSAEHSHSGGCLYIFLINSFYHLTCLCNNFYGLSALVGLWSSAFIRRIIYKFLNVCPYDYTAFANSGKIGIPSTG